MPRLSVLTILSTLCVVTASTALAADRGTYRPGMAYASIQASDASICEAQCSGDAQCRGWNFVTVTPGGSNGVCEFNAQDVAPIPSPISVSGHNNFSARSATIIPGSSNTTRVGYVAPPAPKAVTQPTANRAPSGRKIIRQPVLQQRAANPAVYSRPAPQNMQNLSLTDQQNRQRRAAKPSAHQRPMQQHKAQQHPAQPRFQHSLDDGHARRAAQPTPRTAPQNRARFAARPTPPPSVTQPPIAKPPLSHQRFAPHQMDQPQAYASRPAMARPDMGQPAPQIVPQPASQPSPQSSPQRGPQLTDRGSATPPLAPTAPMPAQNRRLAGAPQMPQPQAPMRPQAPMHPQAPQRPQVKIPAEMSPQPSVAQAQQNLFGSLYDDVNVPRPVDPAAIAANPDAPIPTVSYVPAAPIAQSPLGPAATPQR